MFVYSSMLRMTFIRYVGVALTVTPFNKCGPRLFAQVWVWVWIKWYTIYLIEPLCMEDFVVSHGTFTTPNYPMNYYKDHTCIWIIHAFHSKYGCFFFWGGGILNFALTNCYCLSFINRCRCFMSIIFAYDLVCFMYNFIIYVLCQNP